MAKAPLVVLCALLLATAALAPAGDTDNASSAYGFVCRLIPGSSLAVVTPLHEMFSPGSRVRFYDDRGEVCATGVVRSSYRDLAYVAVEGRSMERLRKGFIVSSPESSEEARMFCPFSRNIPLVIEKGVRAGHAVPPNVIVIRFRKDRVRPVYFRHYVHEMGCRSCHHRELDTPCRSCHPAEEGAEAKISFGECARQKCMGCHEGHKEKSEECVWCHG